MSFYALQSTDMNQLFSLLTLSNTASETPPTGKCTVAKLPQMSDQLFSLKERVHSFLLERYFMSSLSQMLKFQKSFALREELKRERCVFLYKGAGTIISMDQIVENASLPLLQLACKIERFINTHIIFRMYETFDRELEFLVNDIFALWQGNPQCRQETKPFLDHLRYTQLRSEFQQTWDQICPEFPDATKYVALHPKSTPYLEQLVRLHSEHSVQCKDIKKRTCVALAQQNDPTELQTKYADIESGCQRIFTNLILELLARYETEMPQIAEQYREAFSKLRECEKRELGFTAITKICSPGERALSELYYLHPTEFVKKIIDTNCLTHVDKLFLELAARSPQKHIKKAKRHLPCEPKKDILPSSTQAPSQEEPSKEIPPLIIEPSVTNPPQDAASPAPLQEQVFLKKRTPKKKNRSVKIPKKNTTTIPFPVREGDGPNLSLEYTWHVRRWEKTSGFNPFLQDSRYTNTPPKKRDEERLRHSFGRALDNVLVTLTKPFIAKSALGAVLRKNYCLPGEIVLPNGSSTRGIFRITLNAQEKIMHKFFTKMSSNQLVEKYIKEGSFQSDAASFELEDPLLPSPQHEQYSLPDDGSRISHVRPNCISVQCTDGTVLNVIPFDT